MTTAVRNVVTVEVDGLYRHAGAPGEVAEVVDLALARERDRGAAVYVAREPYDGAVEERPGHEMRVNVSECGRFAAISLVVEGEGAWHTAGGDERAPRVWFDATTPTAFRSSSVLPIDRVRGAVAEFCRTGRRPGSVAWQPAGWY